MGSKESIAIEAFREAYAKHLARLTQLGYGDANEVEHSSKLHTSWTDFSCVSEIRKIEFSITLFTSALWRDLEGSVVISLVRNVPSRDLDDYLNFKMFLEAHGINHHTWRFPMAEASDDEIREGCERVVKNCAELLFTHGLGLLTGKVWEAGHYERKD